MASKSLLSSLLIAGFVLFSPDIFGQQDCNEISASIEVTQETQTGSGGSIKMTFEHSASQLVIYLVGPRGYLKTDIQVKSIKELKKGRYTLVMEGRKEEDNFCQKHFQFTIK